MMTLMSKTQILQRHARHILATTNRSGLIRRSHQTLSAVKMDLEQCQKQGHQVKPCYIRGLIKNLRDVDEFSKALEASEWMCEQKEFNIFSEDYAARLHLVETVLGMEEAEKFFESIPENMRDYSVYDILLRSYTRSEKTLDKAEATFERMRDLGFLLKPSPFNSMISLYGKLNKQNMVEKLQRELKENNVEIDSLQCDLKENNEDVTVASIKRKIDMYGNVPGSNTKVHRVWNEYKKRHEKDDRNRCVMYSSVIKSLLKLDDVQGAYKIYGEWDSYEAVMDMSIPDLLISRLRAEGNDAKAEELVEAVKQKNNVLGFVMFGKIGLVASMFAIAMCLYPVITFWAVICVYLRRNHPFILGALCLSLIINIQH